MNTPRSRQEAIAEFSRDPVGTGRLLKLCGSIAVAALFCSLLGAPAFADAGDPPGRAARLSVVQGNVSLMPSGATDWSQATINYPMTTGDRLYTDQSARTELEIGNVAVRASESTDLTVANLSDELLQLGLGQGVIRLHIYEKIPGSTIEVDTPNGALTIEEAGDYRVETYPNDNSTFVIVNRGALDINGGGVSQALNSGQAVKLTGTDEINAEFVNAPAVDDFDHWCDDRDRRYESSASVKYVGREVPGYYDLDQNGRWDEVPDVGPVWYPVAVPVGWAPYRFGHWAWVSPWGWTWIDDAPWGFCPFHYGRWAMFGGRWGWVPGPVVVRPVYAPALVAFIGGPHFGISIGIGAGVGWFPLGPREAFIPWYHHSDTYVRQVNVTNVRNISVTNITNVTNVTYVNQRAATSVVPAEAFRTGAPVRRQLMAVNANAIAHAQVIAHPAVTPTAVAVGTGRPAVNPPRVAPMRTTPVESQRPMRVVNNPSQPTPPVRPAAPFGTFNRPAATPQPGGPPRSAAAGSANSAGWAAATRASARTKQSASAARKLENVFSARSIGPASSTRCSSTRAARGDQDNAAAARSSLRTAAKGHAAGIRDDRSSRSRNKTSGRENQPGRSAIAKCFPTPRRLRLRGRSRSRRLSRRKTKGRRRTSTEKVSG